MEIGEIACLILVLLMLYIYIAKKKKINVYGQLQDDTVMLEINMNRSDRFSFYDFVQWSDESNDIPIHHLNENTKKTWWFKSERTPERNEHRVVCISLPTAKDIHVDTQFWCLYSPALSAINGLGEFPEEIAQSGLVFCSVLECLGTTNEGCWFRVSVVDCNMFDTALVDIEVNQAIDKFLTSIELFECFHKVQWKNYIYVLNYATNGYIGNEFVIQKQADKYHLVCYTEWVYDTRLKENASLAWYGNAVLSEESLNKLNL